MLSDAKPLRSLSLAKLDEFPLHTVFGMATPGYAKAITSPSLKYKIFKVNGEIPSVPADQVIIAENDEIRWEFVDFATYSW